MKKNDFLTFEEKVKCHDGRIGIVWYPDWTLGVLVRFEDGSYKYYFANNILLEKV